MSLQAPLPHGAAGGWCHVALRLPGTGPWWACLELSEPARDQIVRACFLGPTKRARGGLVRATLVHVPAGATAITFRLYGQAIPPVTHRIAKLPRLAAAALLIWQGRHLIRRAVAGNAQGRLGRLRAVLGQAPARRGETPPYATWIALCEMALPPPPQTTLAHQVVVIGNNEPARRATIAALHRQTLATPEPIVVTTPEDWGRVTAPWAILLQAGEILAPDALAWFAHAATRTPGATFITADCDSIDTDGARANPLLKPAPDPLLLKTGLLTQGACAAAWPPPAIKLPANAHAVRRALAEARQNHITHIARILTHLGPDAGAPPFSHLHRQRDSSFLPHVTALVPTALRSTHVPACLARIISHTAYPAFETRVLLSNAAGARHHLLRRVQGLRGARVCDIALPSFNFATVNNAAAEQACTANPDGLLLLINDDVAPVHADWLDALVAHMQDPSVGIVGARLLYGNGMVQHEGVIMGLAHLCEHAGRLRPANQPGPHGIATMDRDVSAVTAACLLIRASLYRDLCGMDTGFAIALNDVDLCLRARQAGWRVVYAAGSVLYHYESLSLGRHYAGRRAALEALEVHRLRDRWASVIADDPFYNPLASLQPGQEWQPAFPPRGTGIAVRPSNSAATG
jgi:hypothetical protein